LGFTEAFTANHPCRHCSMDREDFNKQFFENDDLVKFMCIELANVKTICAVCHCSSPHPEPIDPQFCRLPAKYR